MTNNRNETLGEYWARTRPPSAYERIDRLMMRGFAGLIAAGTSPIIAAAINGWVGWPVFIAGASAYIYSMIAIGRVR